MSQPPDNVSASMTPNPGDGQQRRSRDEEARRQRAIVHLVETLAGQAGIGVSTEPGCIDPAAKPNPERSATIKADTNPRLLSFTRRVQPSIEVGKITTADGDVIEKLKIRKGAETTLSLNLQDLKNLCSGVIGGTRDAVLAIMARVGSFVRRRGERPNESEEQDEEADYITDHEYDPGDDDFDDPYPPNKEDRD